MSSLSYSLRWTNKGSEPYNPVFCILKIEQGAPIRYFHLDLLRRILSLNDSEYFITVKDVLISSKGITYPNSKPKDFGFELLRSTDPIDPEILRDCFPELFL